jgi:peptidoglycan/LPS O-acetylase OafA/YrhL
LKLLRRFAGKEKAIHEKKSTERYDHIDSLRGLAALSVMYYHIAEFRPADNAFERQIFSLVVDKVDLGKIAVTVFFGISGFVIPFSLFRPSQSPIRDFTINRFFRLYPAYWLSILLAVLVFSVTHFATTPPHVIAVNATMLQQFFGVRNIIGVYWTLQIELIFYALCTALFALGLLQRPLAAVAMIWGLMGVALLLAIGRHVTGKNLPVALPLALAFMYFGYLWRTLIIQRASELRAPVCALLAGFALLWPPIFILAYRQQAVNYTLTYDLAALIFVLGTTRVKINARLIAYLGRISYSLYLVGSVGVVFSVWLLKKYAGAAPTYQVAILGTILGIGAASLIYRFLEEPAIAFGRSLVRRPVKAGPPSAGEIEESEVM